MYKTILNIGATLALLALLIIPAPAATISISNLTDGNPIVTTDLAGTEVVVNFEQAFVSGTLLLPAGTALAPGTRSVFLVEPASDPFGPRVSDFATLTVGQVQQGAAGNSQLISLLFQSDGANGFDRNVEALGPNTPTATETGDFVDVTSLLESSSLLTVRLASDLATAEPAEPGTWMLLVTGLGAAVGYRRLRKTR
jgi:hypothetical protein